MNPINAKLNQSADLLLADLEMSSLYSMLQHITLASMESVQLAVQQYLKGSSTYFYLKRLIR